MTSSSVFHFNKIMLAPGYIRHCRLRGMVVARRSDSKCVEG